MHKSEYITILLLDLLCRSLPALETVDAHSVLDFVEDIGFFNRI